MITLREKHAGRDAAAKSKLKEVFEFRNAKAAVVLNDVNYWTFGELQEDIPEAYYDDDPRVMMDYQLKKIQSQMRSNNADLQVHSLYPVMQATLRYSKQPVLTGRNALFR